MREDEQKYHIFNDQQGGKYELCMTMTMTINEDYRQFDLKRPVCRINLFWRLVLAYPNDR